MGYSRRSSRRRVSPLLLGAKRRFPMGAAGWRYAHTKRTLRVRVVVIGALEELPFVCPVAVAIGSLIMIDYALQSLAAVRGNSDERAYRGGAAMRFVGWSRRASQPASLCRRLVFLLRPAHHDLEGVIRQWLLQRLRLVPRRAYPHVALLGGREGPPAVRRSHFDGVAADIAHRRKPSYRSVTPLDTRRLPTLN